MPRLLPDLAPGELSLVKSSAERRFYEACRAQLPPEWTVLFSTPWVGTTPSGRKYDGEADFVLLVPTLGMLVVEVKGGGVAYDPIAGRWESVDRGGERHAIKDPFRQATAEKHQLIQILLNDQRWRRAHPGRLLAGHAVFFADLDHTEAATTPESPTAIVGGRAHLQRLQAWAEGVLRFWAGRDVGWDGLRADGLKAAEQVLHGRIDVRPLISTQLHAEEAIRIQLTQQQSRILRGIGARKRAAICGGAGTGKTLLALEKARQLAETTGETLLLCYNHLLADYLKTACQGVARLYAMNYHQLCSWRVAEARRLTGRDLLRDARAAYPPSRPQDEFDLVLPHALALSCEATPLRFDAIVIDEGQDFKEEYWLPIEWLMRDPDQSCLYVFYDQNQALYTRARSLPISDPPFVLTFNCRNTRHIHESAYRFFQGEPTDAPTGNEGSPIASLTAPSVKAQAAAIHAAIVALIDRESVDASQIAVVVCGEPKETYYQAVERMPLPRGSRWVVEGAAADKGVRLETVRRFKGLEADVVFLWGADSLPSRDEREILYVGISRAKSRLTVVGAAESCQRLMSRSAHS